MPLLPTAKRGPRAAMAKHAALTAGASPPAALAHRPPRVRVPSCSARLANAASRPMSAMPRRFPAAPPLAAAPRVPSSVRMAHALCRRSCARRVSSAQLASPSAPMARAVLPASAQRIQRSARRGRSVARAQLSAFSPLLRQRTGLMQFAPLPWRARLQRLSSVPTGLAWRQEQLAPKAKPALLFKFAARTASAFFRTMRTASVPRRASVLLRSLSSARMAHAACRLTIARPWKQRRALPLDRSAARRACVRLRLLSAPAAAFAVPARRFAPTRRRARPVQASARPARVTHVHLD